MESSTLNVRVDAEDKKSFEEFCNKVGMNVSTAVNMFIKAVLREQRLPFEVCNESYDDYVYRKLKEAEDEMSNNPKFYTIEEVKESINKIIDKNV